MRYAISRKYQIAPENVCFAGGSRKCRRWECMSAATEIIGCAGSETEVGSTQRSWLVRAHPLLCRMVPYFALLCVLSWWFFFLKPDFSWDDAEPEILDQAWRLANGDSIYRAIDSPPYAIPIYTPLYLACVAALMKVSGLSYVPARLVSFVSGLCICWAFICLCRVWNRKAREGLWAGFLLFLVPAFLFNAFRSHVQMMAVALSLWSLFFFLRNKPWYSLVLSPVFAILAFYTKQTQIALPLALVIYLALRNRRWLIPYVSVMAAGIFIPFLLLQKSTGGLFYIDTVQLACLSYDVWSIPQIFIHHAGPILIFIGFSCAIAYRRLHRLELEPIDLYFLCVFAITILSLGRVGAHGQYVVELLVVTLAYILRTTGLPHIRGKERWVSIQVLFLLLYAPLYILLEQGPWARAANKSSSEVYRTIQASSGPILSQQGSYPLFGRGGIYIQLFHFSSLWRAGQWDQSRILSDVARQTFSYVITEFPIEDPVMSEDRLERFTPEMISMLRSNYQYIYTAYPYYLYGPRDRITNKSRRER